MRGRQQLLLAGALVGMHACWLFAWAQMIERAASAPVQVASGVLPLLVTAVAWRSGLERTGLHRLAREAAYWALLLVAASLMAKAFLFPGTPFFDSQWILALPRAPISLFFEPRVPELILLLSSAAAWYMGQRRVFRHPDYATLLADFQFGLVMLLLAFLIGYGFDVEVSHPLLLTLAFFAPGIAAIATARSAAGHTETRQLSGGQLSTTVLGSIAAVCFVALVLATIAQPGAVEAVLNAIRYMASLVGRTLAYLVSLLPAPEYGEVEPPPAPATGDDSFLREWYRSLPVPAMLRRGIQIVWTIVILGVLLFSLWRMCEQVLEWLRRRRQPIAGATVESTGRSIWSDLAAFATFIVGLVRRAAASLARRISARGRPPAPRTRTEVYLDLIRWTGRKIQPRAPWQSPYEYLSSLMPLMPAVADELALVTDGYVDERYGGREFAVGDLTRMAEAARRIRNSRRNRFLSRWRGEMK
ncbi:MAG: DUF4129 domain-containing protein [Chloroflexota bacterium]